MRDVNVRCKCEMVATPTIVIRQLIDRDSLVESSRD